jgi:hypothetical protein
MQPFAFEFFRVGICDPRMTAIAGLHFQTLFGERPFTGVNRSLARKIASDSFGSVAGAHERPLTGTQFFWLGAPIQFRSDRLLSLRCRRSRSLLE